MSKQSNRKKTELKNTIKITQGLDSYFFKDSIQFETILEVNQKGQLYHKIIDQKYIDNREKYQGKKLINHFQVIGFFEMDGTEYQGQISETNQKDLKEVIEKNKKNDNYFIMPFLVKK